MKTFFWLLLLIGATPMLLASAPVCAQVKIRIEQELTFEREAFEARMTINNDLPNTALSNISVTVRFADAEGNEVLATSDPNNTSALFFLRLQDGSSIPQSIATGTSATIRWLIIPAPGAGGANPLGTRYEVGATLTYEAGSGPEIVEVSPDYIFVRPMPRLTLDYFLPGEVNGDDPFTPRIEEPEPFSLGVRIMNKGFGAAQNLKIESGQPQIIDNRQGLLVGFEITGASVDDQPSAPTLLADFGTIAAGATRVGRWTMLCSLYGRFIDFTASFSHADELGGRLTSLIDEVNARLMLRDVLADLPGRDNIRDFLAYRYTNGTDLYLFESEGQDSPVNDLSPNATLDGSGSTRVITHPGAVGHLYIRVPDPFRGRQRIVSALRADGKLLVPANFWLSKTYDPVRQVYDHYLNVFDSGNDAAHSYTLQFEQIVFVNRPPELLNPGDRILRAGSTYSLLVVASDPDADDITLSALALPAGASFSRVTNGISQFTWSPAAVQEGIYPVTFIASDGALEDRVTINLTVTTGSLWEAWTRQHFGEENDPAIIGPDADPDGDFLTNSVEYALNLDPTRADQRAVEITVEPDAQGRLLTILSYVRRTDDPALRIDVVGSDSGRSDNPAWQPQPQALSGNQDGVPDGMERWRAVDSVPLEGTTARRFLELRASFDL